MFACITEVKVKFMFNINKLFFICSLSLGLVCSLDGGAATLESAVVEQQLANGLRVLVKPDRRAPVVVSMVWYRVGSIDEHNGQTGVAHMLEHMMFKGTRKLGVGEFSKRIAAAGGRENAFTSNDYTGYFQTLHKSALPLAFELEADRMANLMMNPAEFDKEIKVVMEERRWRTDDKPLALVRERLMATALIAHPARNPVVGWMNDLENMRLEDAQAFYNTWYAPNNATIVVVGDVEPAAVFALAQQHFGTIASKSLPVRKPQLEPPALGMNQIRVQAPAELPYVLMAYRAPRLQNSQNDSEYYALEMLEGVLSGHEAARLPQRMVKTDQIANSAGAEYDGIGQGPGFFYLRGTPGAGRTAEQVEQALRREVKRVVDEGVTEDELNRVKAQLMAAQVYQRDSMFYQAQQIGWIEMSGFSHRDLDILMQQLQKVTVDQIRAVAKKYLIDSQLTVAYLEPQPLSGQKRPSAPPAGVRHAN